MTDKTETTVQVVLDLVFVKIMIKRKSTKSKPAREPENRTQKKSQ